MKRISWLVLSACIGLLSPILSYAFTGSQDPAQTMDKGTKHLADAIRITTDQTALSAKLLSQAIEKNTQMTATIRQGQAIGERILQATKDKTLGDGLSLSVGCATISERQVANTKNIITQDLVVAQTSAVAASHFVNAAKKRALRTQSHLTEFCDITEVAQGICLPNANGLGGSDTSYGAWQTKMVLGEEDLKMAQAYMFNSIDPAYTLDSKCDTDICNVLQVKERNYNALSSMVHNAYLNQINDRTILNLKPNVSAVK